MSLHYRQTHFIIILSLNQTKHVPPLKDMLSSDPASEGHERKRGDLEALYSPWYTYNAYTKRDTYPCGFDRKRDSEKDKPYYICYPAEETAAVMSFQSHRREKQPCIFKALHSPRHSHYRQTPQTARNKPRKAVKPPSANKPYYISENSHKFHLSFQVKFSHRKIKKRLNSD